MKEIKKKETSVEISDEMLFSYMDTFGIAKQLNDDHKKQFMEIAKAFGLNPWKREIYPIPYRNKKTCNDDISIITGFEVYLKRAERTGNLNGWMVKTAGKISDNSLKAEITIYRKDWDHPFVHEVYFSEYNMKWNLWLSKPITMLKKVVMAQGFRLAFPDELGGMPYTSDEQWEKEVSNKIVDNEKKIKTYKADPPAKTEKKEIPTPEELDRFEKEMLSAISEENITDWFLAIQKDSKAGYKKIEKAAEIRTVKQLNWFKGKFRAEYGSPQKDLPVEEINEK